MKYIAFCLVFIMNLLCCMASQPEDLTEEDAGLLLFRRKDKAVFVFKKPVQDSNGTTRWECSPFKENGSVVLVPAHCTVLEYLESDLTAEIVEMEFLYNSCSLKHAHRVKADVYINIAKKINSPVISDLFSFLAELNKDFNSIAREIENYKGERYKEQKKRDREKKKAIRKKLQESGGAFQGIGSGSNMPIKGTRMGQRSTQRSYGGYYNAPSRNVLDDDDDEDDEDEKEDSNLALDDFKAAFDQTKAPEIMRNSLAKNGDINFFKVFCMYFIYRQRITSMLLQLPHKTGRELYKEIVKLETDLLLKFRQNLHNTKHREEKYRSVCRNMHGQWEYAAPRDYKSLRERLDSCYNAWHRMYNHSAHTEFPVWGNAVLEVLQMMGNNDLYNRFDAAYLKYKEQNNY